jgi:predicted lipoprotein with Yx(FWY)xxD motif
MMLRFRFLAILSFIGSMMLVAYACAPAPAVPTTTGTPQPTTPISSAFTIAVGSKDGVGNYLVDGNGMTLYWTTRDSVGQSNITGATLANWPAFYAANIVIPSALRGSDFGTITRPEGGNQTTYKGYPLYYFIQDKNPMDTLGQGVAGVWWVVDPAATAPIAAPALSIVSPSNGATVPAGDLTVNVKVDNFNVVDKQGQPNVSGEGHVHFYLDVPAPTTPGQPAIPPSGAWAHVSGTTFTFTNVTPGTHTITVQLINNDHSPLIPIVTAQATITVTGPAVTPPPTVNPPPTYQY